MALLLLMLMCLLHTGVKHRLWKPRDDREYVQIAAIQETRVKQQGKRDRRLRLGAGGSAATATAGCPGVVTICLNTIRALAIEHTAVDV